MSDHPVDPQTRLRELAIEGARRLHESSVLIEGPWPRNGHDPAFISCRHRDCRLAWSPDDRRVTVTAAAPLPHEEPLQSYREDYVANRVRLAVDMLGRLANGLTPNKGDVAQAVKYWTDFALRELPPEISIDARAKLYAESLAAAAPREEPALKSLIEAAEYTLCLLRYRQHGQLADAYRHLETALTAARGEEPAPPPRQDDVLRELNEWRSYGPFLDAHGCTRPKVAALPEAAPRASLTLAEYDALVLDAARRLSVNDQNELIARDGKFYEEGYFHGQRTAPRAEEQE